MQWGQSKSTIAILAMSLGMASFNPASANEEYEIEMLSDSEGGGYRFEPEFLQIDNGDRVRFTSLSPVHASKSIPSMVPNEWDNWTSRNGEDVIVRFDEPGVYGYKCSAHYSLGMVGLIIVDDEKSEMSNLVRAKHPPAAAQKFEQLLREVKAVN